MICPACDRENRDGANFCRHCGNPLDQPQAPETEVAPADIAVSEDEDAAFAGQPADKAGPGAESDAGGDGEPSNEGGEVVADDGTGAGAVAQGVELEIESMEVVEPEAVETGLDDLQVEESPLPGKSTSEAKPGVPGGEQDAATIEIEVDAQPVEPAPGEEAVPEVQDEGAAEPVVQGDEVGPLPEWLEDEDGPAGPETEVPGFWREQREPLSPLAVGTVVADRYLVSDVLDAHEASVLYYVRDLWRCWQCGFEGNAPDEAFCAQCGASLDRRPSLRLLEVEGDAGEPPAGETVAARLSHEERTFLLLTEPERKAPLERGNIRFLVGQRSDAGQVRELDEDSILSLAMAPTYGSRTGPVLGLFAVADGMGGHEGGEVASKLALEVLADRVIRTILLPELSGEFRLDEDVVVRLRQAVMAANDEVYLARQKRGNDMGTTLTAVLIRDSRLFVAHVGDCRAFRWNAEGLEQLTVDHSVIASMVASGQAKPEEIYTHPHRSVIYRCVGDQPTVQVDTDILRLTTGDRIIVCCDGLWEMVRNEGIEDVMLEEAEPQAACDLLVKRANLAGGDDNISVVIVQVESV